MFKKSFAVVAALLLMTSNINAESELSSNMKIAGQNCFGLAAWVYDFVIANGGTVAEAAAESARALKDCVETIGFE